MAKKKAKPVETQKEQLSRAYLAEAGFDATWAGCKAVYEKYGCALSNGDELNFGFQKELLAGPLSAARNVALMLVGQPGIREMVKAADWKMLEEFLARHSLPD